MRYPPMIVQLDTLLDGFLNLVEDLVDTLEDQPEFEDGMGTLAKRVDDVDKGLLELRRAIVREQAARAR